MKSVTSWRKGVRIITTSLATLALGISTTATAHAAPVESWTGMGPQLPPQDNIVAAIGHGMTNPAPSPTGANEACTPAEGENPVVLLHGMTSDSYGSFAALAPALKAQGKCVYALDYGFYDNFAGQGSAAAGFIPGFKGLHSINENLAEVSAQIDKIKENTGAKKVDIVGWSQGGTLAAAYAKQKKGEGVGTVVSIAGVLRGTSFMGLSNLHHEFKNLGLPITEAVDGLVGPIGNDLLEESDFMKWLKDGGIEVPGVRYVAISTLFDEAANFIGNSQFSGGDYQNIVVQDGCPGDLTEHLGMPYDQRTIAHTINSLGRNVPVPCTGMVGPFVPGSSL